LKRPTPVQVCVLLGTALFAVRPLQATLLLTPAGTSLGFTLTTFVSGYNAQYGPLSQGISSAGTVTTGSLLNNKIYVFADVDGQTLSSALSSTSYACTTGNCNWSMTTAGGQVYGAQAFGGVFEHFASNGTFTPIPNLQAASLTGYLGVWNNPTNNHLIASSNQGLVDIDPVAGTYRVINASVFPDGITVSPDGTTIYAEVSGTIQSFNLTTGALIRTFSVGHSPDGTGVVSGGILNGFVVVNNNDGTVGLLDPTKANGDPNQYVIIANNGTRGDFVSPDGSNGTLFLSQTDQVARLSCGANCSIGSTNTAPEPLAFALAGLGLVGLAGVRRYRRG